MKKIVTFITIAGLLTLFSCKKVRNKSMVVWKDCSGSYLLYADKNYHVCNFEKLSSYDHGMEVTATFKKLDNCSDAGRTNGCTMVHENDGWIEIIKVK